jgi:hypothetical protein
MLSGIFSLLLAATTPVPAEEITLVELCQVGIIEQAGGHVDFFDDVSRKMSANDRKTLKIACHMYFLGFKDGMEYTIRGFANMPPKERK